MTDTKVSTPLKTVAQLQAQQDAAFIAAGYKKTANGAWTPDR
ncbi:MAG: hypothetical protein PHF37_00545 [Phycisphaerae bacterium]|nr:hypothetical protein [Phycisphaerae bacterium]